MDANTRASAANAIARVAKNRGWETESPTISDSVVMPDTGIVRSIVDTAALSGAARRPAVGLFRITNMPGSVSCQYGTNVSTFALSRAPRALASATTPMIVNHGSSGLLPNLARRPRGSSRGKNVRTNVSLTMIDGADSRSANV